MLTSTHDPPVLTSNRSGRIAFGVSPVGCWQARKSLTTLAAIMCLQRNKTEWADNTLRQHRSMAGIVDGLPFKVVEFLVSNLLCLLQQCLHREQSIFRQSNFCAGIDHSGMKLCTTLLQSLSDPVAEYVRFNEPHQGPES